jgi:glycosyltransferase involved in cell wall biosynthesis
MLRVSVIIPTYNRAVYLRQALQSVFAQTFAPFEVIVVDDGSGDNTTEVLHAFNSRLRCFCQEHKGVSAARNLGLQVAKGDVIAWLDADDVWEPDFLATVIPILHADEAIHGIYTGFFHIDAAGNRLPQSSQKVVPPSELYSSLIDSCFILTSTLVVRRDCFEQVGLFDPRLEICEDYDMLLRLAKDFTIAGVPHPLVAVRVHESNTIRNTAAFCRFRLALTDKHFGGREGDPRDWSAEKRRAHGHALNSVALRYIQDSQDGEAWQFLKESFTIWPDLMADLSIFYELACGDQPRGFRGQAIGLDIEGNAARMLSWLDQLFAQRDSSFEAMRKSAYGNAYHALAMLSDQAERWETARRYLFQAIQANPRLLIHYPVARRLAKLCAGQRLVDFGRRLLGDKEKQVVNLPPSR